ncbi:hypothetical protein [Actinokineospora globicatena]|uniref:Uncharacterized protein n=1 Tax=Actinokineospora globicatena TaxID=103729 RepID=A0A9W6QJ15_9PSEU|nr:hypothetical protein [Actinokineospora globicatena]GLW89409.1 hypothetical protein Aglo03_02250 [Actinokineospora globicatena]
MIVSRDGADDLSPQRYPSPFPPVELRAEDTGHTEVVVPKAGVYAEPDPGTRLVIKQQGEVVTYPRAVGVVLGTDNERYRIVCTPTRTASGYAFMRADALAPADDEGYAIS